MPSRLNQIAASMLAQNYMRLQKEGKSDDEIIRVVLDMIQKENDCNLDSDKVKKALIDALKTEKVVEIEGQIIISVIDGKIEVSINREMSNVEMLGLLEGGKAQIISNMINTAQKINIVQN